MLTQKYFIPLLLSLTLYTPVIIADDIIGISKPIHDVELSVSVDGVITKINVKEGQRVKKGDELLRLDDRLYTREADRRNLILKDNTRLTTSQYNKEILKKLLDNTNRLYVTRGAVSEEEVKKLTMQYNSLVGEVNSLSAEKKREQVEYDIAKEQIEQRILRTPINGVIADIVPDVGEWAEPSKMLIRVVDTSKGLLEININVNLLHKQQLHTNSKVDIEFLGGSVIKKQGIVVFISPVVDTSSSLVRINIEYDNQDGDVLLGTSAKLLLPEVQTSNK
jgi:RND family efflux transporter MFP subunit